MFVSQASCGSFFPSLRVEMEGSSDSARHKSGSSRGFNPMGFSDRNIRSLPSVRFNLFSDTHQDFIGLRKARERLISASVDNQRIARGFSRDCLEDASVNPYLCALERDDVSLRHWLDKPERQVDELECFHIFTQIVEIVNVAHSQGVVVQNVRPSCFVMSSFNRVSFIESVSCSDCGSNSVQDGLYSRTNANCESSSLPLERQKRGRLRYENFQPLRTSNNSLLGISFIHSSFVYPMETLLLG
ncbi:hypothetical protein MLD38_027099 [Melastoma candidum]|uniref:Uncharacterized protein n=1 Tax=Melastoma candidum TaxID=119954 RepID=A0ACB9P1P2_9MYRT|nr:hypothetical protein MLD38_027099 [Melastoma candidum]